VAPLHQTTLLVITVRYVRSAPCNHQHHTLHSRLLTQSLHSCWCYTCVSGGEEYCHYACTADADPFWPGFSDL